MALAGMAGRAMAGTVGTGVEPNDGQGVPDGGQRAARPASGTGQCSKTDWRQRRMRRRKPRAVVTGVAAELREFAKLRDEGILTDEEYTEQKNRLLGR